MRRNILLSSQFCIKNLLRKGGIIPNETKNFRQYKIWNENTSLEGNMFVARSYAQSKQTNCWSCHKPHDSTGVTGTIESFFCSNCGSLREINKNNSYFSLFGIAEKFQVDQNELTKIFRQFQSVLHPDKFSNNNQTEQNISADISSLVNKAYKTLYTPIKRAEYILEWKGITIPEDNNIVDKDFLLEIMERNEEVDDASGSLELKNLLKRVNQDIQKSINDFDANLQKNDLEGAKSSLILLRYYISLETSIKNKLRQEGIVD